MNQRTVYGFIIYLNWNNQPGSFVLLWLCSLNRCFCDCMVLCCCHLTTKCRRLFQIVLEQVSVLSCIAGGLKCEGIMCPDLSHQFWDGYWCKHLTGDTSSNVQTIKPLGHCQKEVIDMLKMLLDLYWLCGCWVSVLLFFWYSILKHNHYGFLCYFSLAHWNI